MVIRVIDFGLVWNLVTYYNLGYGLIVEPTGFADALDGDKGKEDNLR